MRGKSLEIPEDIDTPKMVEWVIKWSGGVIKNQRQAEYALLGVAIIFFGLSMYFFFGWSGGGRSPNISPSMMQGPGFPSGPGN
jgi:hypothetical protein